MASINELINADLPCFKYILRAISTQDDIPSFAKEYFRASEKAGLPESDSMSGYVSLKSALTSENRGLKLTEYRGKTCPVSDFRENVMSDENIPLSKSCRDYAKDRLGNILRPGKGGSCPSLCSLCRSFRASKNRCIREEFLILRYMFNGMEAVQHILELCDDNPRRLFRSYLDLTSDLGVCIAAREPVIQPVTQIFASCIIGASPGFSGIDSSEDPEDTLETRFISLKPVLISSIHRKCPELDQALSPSGVSPEALLQNGADFLLDVLKACGDPGKEQADRAAEHIRNTYDQMAKRNTAGKDHAIKETASAAGQLFRLITSMGLEQSTTTRSITESPPTERVPLPKPENSANPQSSGFDGICLSFYNLDVQGECEQETSLDSLIASADETKLLPIEIGTDGQGGYAFIAYNIRDSIFHSFMFETFSICSDLKRLLLSRKVVKLCWQPYYLYSICAGKGLLLNNVHSICSMERFLRPGTSPVRKAVLADYAGKWCDSTGITRKTRETSLLQSMQYYDSAFVMQGYLMLGDRKSEARIKYLDSLLGKSFMRSQFLNDDSLLLSEAGERLRFNPRYNLSVKKTGYVLRYRITGHSMTEDEVMDLFCSSLSSIEQETFFRRSGLYLLTISPNQAEMDLLVEEIYLDYVMTFFHLFFDRNMPSGEGRTPFHVDLSIALNGVNTK